MTHLNVRLLIPLFMALLTPLGACDDGDGPVSARDGAASARDTTSAGEGLAPRDGTIRPETASPADAGLDRDADLGLLHDLTAAFDQAAPDIGSPPECITSTDCGDGRGCLAGICRNECLIGLFCLEGTPSGLQCESGLCVECTQDAHCPGTRYQCDLTRRLCVDRPFDPSLTKIGIFYHTWHCPASQEVYDISEILAGNASWGPENKQHWWDQPVDGYYCLSQNDALLTKHATLLRDAGLDFVFLDVTNHTYVGAGSDRTPQMILQPLDRLLAVWSAIPGAPRVVPWVPVEEPTENANLYTVDAINARLSAYPGMHFNYQGKPLIMITDNSMHPVNAQRLAALAVNYTVRRMWANLKSNAVEWSFLEACKDDPTSSKPCNQSIGLLNGQLEQIPIATAYQATYMSLPSATPKHQGLTFRKQFETLLLNPEVPLATITGWNEWLSGRTPCGEHAVCPCSGTPSYPNGCFVDQYDIERNRDIEPGVNAMGDYYYQLMKACIALFRSGAICDAAHAGDLCCKDY